MYYKIWIFNVILLFPTSCTSLGFSLFVPQTRVSRECYSETYLAYQKTDKVIVTHLWHTIEVRTKETNRKERTKKEKAKRPSFQRALIEQTGDEQTYKRPSHHRSDQSILTITPVLMIFLDLCCHTYFPTTFEPTCYRNRWSSSRPPQWFAWSYFLLPRLSSRLLRNSRRHWRTTSLIAIVARGTWCTLLLI